MWMSDATFLTASVRIRFTSLTTGASSEAFASSAASMSSLVLDQVDVGVVEVAHHVLERGRLVVVAVDGAPDRLFRGDDGLDVVAGEELDVVEREDVRRVARGEDQRGPGAVHRDHVVLDRDFFGDQLDHGAVDLELVEVDRGHAVLLGDEVGELGLVEQTDLRDLRAEPVARALRLCARLAQLLLGQQILLDQELADPLVHNPPRTPAPHACAIPPRCR